MGRLYFYLHENHKNQLNVGEYTSPMDGMGYGEPPGFLQILFSSTSDYYIPLFTDPMGTPMGLFTDQNEWLNFYAKDTYLANG